MKKLMIMCLWMLMSLCAMAYQEYTINGITWKYTVSNGKVTIGAGGSNSAIPKSTVGSVEIPAYINGRPVTSIGEYAFYDCSSLTSVSIPNSVTSIGANAFYDCSSLWSVTIPNSVTSIGLGAFSFCSRLTSVTIPDSVTSIEVSAFYRCSLKSVTIPNSVTSIGRSAFSECRSLTRVTIPDGVMSIGDSAFSGCSSLTSVTIPNSVTSIGRSAFSECSSLTSVTIRDGVMSIGDSAFSGCSSLTSVTIPDGVTSIGNFAFGYCSSLTSVTIPNSVTNISGDAFSGCVGLADGDGFLIVGDVLYDYFGNGVDVVIPNYVKHIQGSVFYNCSSLTSVTIPDGVMSIGDSAFEYCSSLTSVTIPNSVMGIGNYAFGSCWSLTSVTIPNSVTNIGYQAFGYCSSLTSIVIPDSVTSIGDYAFYGCSSLTNIVFEGNAPNIGGVYCFSYTHTQCTAFVKRRSSGWNVDIPGTWMGIMIEYLEEDDDGGDSLSGITNFVTSVNGPASLQAAIEAANEGDVILVGPGTYSPIRTNGKKITIKSTEGAASTIIDGGNANRCATLADVALDEEEDGIVIEGSTLVGFTLMRGYNRCVEGVTEICTDGGAVFGGTVVNCIIKDSESYWIEDESDDGCGGGACRAALYNCLITGNTAAEGAGASDCILYNCTIVANVDDSCPVAYSEAYNCIISGGGYLDTWNTEYNDCIAPSGEYIFDDVLSKGDIKFVNPAAGDYRLQQGSAAIDAGTPAYVQSLNSQHGDLDQNKRIKDIIDIGAYEYGAPSLVVPVYEMSFASGGATEGDAPEVILFKADEEVELPGCGFLVWPKHTFVGWSDGISTYDSGAIYTGESNVVMTAQWSRNELAVPVISAPETFEADSCEVTITCDSAATIHYTLDGAEPTAESPVYTEPIVITGTTEIKAIAIRDNYFDSSIASFKVIRGIWTFGEYLNWEDQEFTTSGDVEWIREKGVSDDGYALKSGKILRNQKSCLTTTVQGAGTISFMLKVSSEADEETSEPYDGFVLAVDGVDVTELIGGEIDWRRVSFKIVGDGLHNIEWRYEKDKSVDVGEDCAWIDEIVWAPEDPIPDLGALATASEVAAALEGSEDAKLAENIKTAAEYVAYRAWALGLDGITPEEVKASPNAWLSYALNTDKLIVAAPKEGDVVIDTFEIAATEGAFELTVKIDGVEVGDSALEANLKKVFDIEGAENLVSGGAGFSTDNVEVNAAEPENGNVKFTVMPKMGNGELGTGNGETLESFFFRVKMK